MPHAARPVKEDIMKYIHISGTDLTVSNIVMGCMRLNSLSKAEAERLIRTAMEEGINLFDHADIYGGGNCEELFAEAVGMNPSIRDQMLETAAHRSFGSISASPARPFDGA